MSVADPLPPTADRLPAVRADASFPPHRDVPARAAIARESAHGPAAPTPAPTPAPSPGRFAFLDALRGIAALAVVAHHASNTIDQSVFGRDGTGHVLPAPLRMLCDAGAGGVQIFFVLSGFVIALSLRSFRPSANSIAWFAVRRQVRLDPAYWAALAFASLLALVRPGTGVPIEFDTISANVAYLHKFLGLPDVLGVAWTLCIEVQFYLAFVAILWIAARVARHRPTWEWPVATALVIALGAWSVAQPKPSLQTAWFVPFWYYFAGGVLCCWAWIGRIPRRVLALGLCGFLVALHASFKGVMVGLPTCLLIYAVARTNRTASWGGGPVLQYFGRLSYSLYLVHLPIMTAVLLGDPRPRIDGVGSAVLWGAIVTALSIGVAHVLHVTIEGPTARLATKLKRKPKPTIALDAAPVTPTPALAEARV